MPLVSVIVPTRDRVALLARAISSLLAQESDDFEIIVVDNNAASAPLTPTTFAELGDPRVRIQRAAEVRSAAAARNVGLEKARGEWVTYLDDDDAYRPSKISRQLARAFASKSPLVLCGGEIHLRGRARVVQIGCERFSGDQLLNDVVFGAPYMFHRRSPVRFDETLSAGEDVFFGQALLSHWNLDTVPAVPSPLVDVYQDGPVRPRTNLQGEASWRAARRLWWTFGQRYSPEARRLFVLRALIARYKLAGKPKKCLTLAWPLLRAGKSQARFAANALLVASGWGRGRFVT